MNKKTSTAAILTSMLDAQAFKRVYGWSKPTVEFYSDYMDVEFRIYNTIRELPENHADEWRMYASEDKIVFILKYYYKDEL